MAPTASLTIISFFNLFQDSIAKKLLEKNGFCLQDNREGATYPHMGREFHSLRKATKNALPHFLKRDACEGGRTTLTHSPDQLKRSESLKWEDTFLQITWTYVT